MKKKIFAVLLIVAIVTALAVGLTACNNNGGEDAKSSNAETLGTAAAVIMKGMAGASAAGEGEEESGLNITFGTDAASTIAGEAFNTGIKYFAQSYLLVAASGMQAFVDGNTVKIENLEKDSTEFVAENDYTIKISMTTVGADNEKVTETIYLALKTNGADLEGKTNFNFTLSILVPPEEEGGERVVEVTTTGTATYNAEIGGLVFSFTPEDGEITVNAYATKTGKVALAIITNDSPELENFNSSINIEIGKLSDTQFGANVKITVAVPTITATIDASVIADQSDTSKDLAISGNVNVTIEPLAGPNNYNVSATITGKAAYDSTTSMYAISASGAANVTTEAKTPA